MLFKCHISMILSQLNRGVAYAKEKHPFWCAQRDLCDRNTKRILNLCDSATLPLIIEAVQHPFGPYSRARAMLRCVHSNAAMKLPYAQGALLTVSRYEADLNQGTTQ
jgi:hypothetical protein